MDGWLFPKHDADPLFTLKIKSLIGNAAMLWSERSLTNVIFSKTALTSGKEQNIGGL